MFTCKSQEPLCFPHGLLLPVLISRLEVTQSASEFESVTSGADVPDRWGSVLAGVAVMEFGGGVLLLGSHHHSHDPSIHTTPVFIRPQFSPEEGLGWFVGTSISITDRRLLKVPEPFRFAMSVIEPVSAEVLTHRCRQILRHHRSLSV